VTVSVGDYELVYDPSIGESEPWYVNDHTFVRDRVGVWHLIGITHAEPMAPHDETHFAHATAPALHGPWTKHPFALTADPDAGETHLWAPHVVAHDDRYWMFYCGGGVDETAYRIHLAVSEDCWAWTRHSANPLVADGFHARDPMILRVDDRWVLYYTATTAPSGGHFVVKAVESDDLLAWTEPRVVYTDARAGTFGGTTESPFVVARDGRYYLFIGPDWGMNVTSYRTTRVLASDDPFHFEASGRVGTIASHAAEVVVDDDGTWWISHCGWSMGGVYLAPLHWA
jgi:beta-fructofuranosidase